MYRRFVYTLRIFWIYFDISFERQWSLISVKPFKLCNFFLKINRYIIYYKVGHLFCTWRLGRRFKLVTRGRASCHSKFQSNNKSSHLKNDSERTAWYLLVNKSYDDKTFKRIRNENCDKRRLQIYNAMKYCGLNNMMIIRFVCYSMGL